MNRTYPVLEDTVGNKFFISNLWYDELADRTMCHASALTIAILTGNLYSRKETFTATGDPVVQSSLVANNSILTCFVFAGPTFDKHVADAAKGIDAKAQEHVEEVKDIEVK